MIKELAPTASMLAALTKAFGGPVDTSKIAIFECIALTPQPISKAGTIFDRAVPQMGMLSDMVSQVQTGGFVKLHKMHDQGGGLFTEPGMPIGNVFEAGIVDGALRSLFYIGRDTAEGQDLIAKLNNGTIDEVSVGAKSKHMRCSECGWDYLGADATMMNIFDRTCANGHIIGENGVHLKLDGLDRWYELSLVSIGAARGAKIVGRTRASLGKEDFQRLAASGFDPEMTSVFMFTSQKKETGIMADNPNNSGATDMAGTLNLIATLSAKEATATAQLAASAANIADLTAKLTAAEAKVAELTAQLTAASEAAKVVDEHKLLLAFVAEQTKAALVASGATNPTVPDNAKDLIASIEAAKLKLHNLPTGQQIEGQGNSEGEVDIHRLSAFRTRR